MGEEFEEIHRIARAELRVNAMETELSPAKKKLMEPIVEFLKSTGYQAMEAPITKQFITKPDYYGTREDHAIAVYSVTDIKNLVGDIPRLKLVRFQLGKGVDYVLLLPLDDASKLIEVLRANEEKHYKIVMKEGFNIWMWDLGNRKVISYFNLPSDGVLREQIDNRGDIVAKTKMG